MSKSDVKTFDFKKILEHKDYKKIIGKLMQGDEPKDIANSLKLKYPEPENGHLRLNINLLEEFRDKYLNQYDFLERVKAAENNSTDKKIFESLLNNKSWRERISSLADEEVDIKKKLRNLLAIIEARMEQVFDKIQQNPEGFKGDYVLLKYFTEFNSVLQTTNKIINNAPDKIIQHNHSIQLIEQTGVAVQEAVRDVLMEMDPELSGYFLDRVSARLKDLNQDAVKPLTAEERHVAVKQLLSNNESNIEDAEYSFEEE